MPSTTEITVSQLSRLIGLPQAPIIIDVRAQDELAADPRLIPGAQHRDPEALMSSAARFDRQSVIVVCQEGLQLSQGVSAWMRHHGIAAQTLEGGFAAWRAEGQLLIPAERVPARDSQGRTVWVTRARPKIVRIACPWLIRRFIDPQAAFLFVAPSEVMRVAKRFQATPFDVSVLGRPGRQVHLRRDDRGVCAGLGFACAAGGYRARRRYRAARPDASVVRPARGIARLFPHVSRRSRPARGSNAPLRCVLSLVPRRGERDARLTSKGRSRPIAMTSARNSLIRTIRHAGTAFL